MEKKEAKTVAEMGLSVSRRFPKLSRAGLSPAQEVAYGMLESKLIGQQVSVNDDNFLVRCLIAREYCEEVSE